MDDKFSMSSFFQHMKNYYLLLQKISEWMSKDGLLFIEHVCHKTLAYQYEASWSYFYTIGAKFKLMYVSWIQLYLTYINFVWFYLVAYRWRRLVHRVYFPRWDYAHSINFLAIFSSKECWHILQKQSKTMINFDSN